MKWNQKATLISAATFSQINHGHSTANGRLMIQIPYGVRNSVRPWITHGSHLAAKLSSSKVRELHVHYLWKDRPLVTFKLPVAWIYETSQDTCWEGRAEAAGQLADQRRTYV